MRDYYAAYREDRYSFLYEPMRRAMSAMGNAMWSFAAIKEHTWYSGYAALTRAIHALEHKQPKYIDQFKDIMAKLGLPLVYPPIPEMGDSFSTVEEVLDKCISLIDDVNEGLSEVIEVCDNANFEPLARYAENVQMENYQNRQWLCEAKAMAENGEMSSTSFDNWLNGTLNVPQKE